MRWLALHFPQLQLDSVYSTQAGTSDKSEGVDDNKVAPEPLKPISAMLVLDDKQCVCQLNDAADQAGVQYGMKLGTASALVDDLQLFNHSSEFEKQRLLEIAHACYQVSADIAVWNSKTLILDVAPMLKLYGSFECYVDALFEVEALDDVRMSAVIANTPLAAYLLSCTGDIDDPLVEQFSRQDVWLPILDRLNVDSVGIAREQSLQLKRLGLHYLGDVRELIEAEHSRKELGNRMGKKLLSHIAQLFGDEVLALTYFKPKDVFSHSVLLEYEVYRTTALLFPIKNILQVLQQYLQRRAKRIQTLSLYFQQRDGSVLSVNLASAEPERDSARWLNLVRLKLESMKLPAPVIGLRLEAIKLLEERVQSSDLFDLKPALSPGQLVARIQAKFGDESVKKMHLEADHRPEYSFRYESVSTQPEHTSRLNEELVSHDSTHVSDGECLKYSKRSQTLRPSLILSLPVPLQESVRFIHGPERIQSAWWTEAPVCRDYFVARNTAQQTLWVFRDQAQEWFVHGLFA